MNEPYFARYQPLLDDWDAFMTAAQRPLPVTIWRNPVKTSPTTELHTLLPATAVPLPWRPDTYRLPATFSPGYHWAYLAGLYHVQEEVSLLPVTLLDIQPGQRVLDLCAAPGNKTAQISVTLQQTGSVIANDRNPSRMRAAYHVLDRLGLHNVTTTIYDGSNYPSAAGLFDRVLVDAPCTGEGTSRKHPNVPDRAALADSLKMVGAQLSLLRKGVQLCRPGGRIVYSTCTYAPEENEFVVDTILQEAAGQLRLLPAQIPGVVSMPGLTTWHGRTLDKSLSHAMRIWPHLNDTGGFFVAVLEKSHTAPTLPPNLPPFLPAEERTPWLETLDERFGIPPATFAHSYLFRASTHRLYLVNPDHQPPTAPKPDATGLFFMRVEGRYPKLTTAAAMLFGAAAHQNSISLEPNQATAYLSRQDFTISAAQAAGCTSTGYVFLGYRGVWLGLGLYHAPTRHIENQFPKGWARPGLSL